MKQPADRWQKAAESRTFSAVDTSGRAPELNRPGREADHSSPSSAEVKNVWSYTLSCRGAKMSTGTTFLITYKVCIPLCVLTCFVLLSIIFIVVLTAPL
jgi:hypothetical protein